MKLNMTAYGYRQRSNQHRREEISAPELLNFRMPERISTPSGGPRLGRHTGHRLKGYSKAMTDSFIQANFTLVIAANHEENASHIDRCRFDWDHVVALEFLPADKVYCPICLHHPVAPRATKCGHVFCFPCLLRFFAQLLGQAAMCPMCYEEIVYENLRRVKVLPVLPRPSAGDWLQFTLLERPKELMRPTIGQARRAGLKSGLPSVSDSDSRFCRIRLATRRDEEAALGEESAALEVLIQQAFADNDWESKVYGEEALALLQVKALEFDNATRYLDQNLQFQEIAYSPTMPSHNSESYIYYQDENGRFIFLHGINMKCLLFEYHEDDLPVEVVGTVLEAETMTLTSDLKKRYRFLSHLPLTSSITFCELDIGSYLSPSTQQKFSSQLKRRHRARKERLREASFQATHDSARLNTFSFQQIEWDMLPQTAVPNQNPNGECQSSPTAEASPDISAAAEPIRVPRVSESTSTFAGVTKAMGNFPALSEQTIVPIPQKNWGKDRRNNTSEPSDSGRRIVLSQRASGAPAKSKQKVELYSNTPRRSYK